MNSFLTSPTTIVEIPTNSYLDSSHENSANETDLSSVFTNQKNEFDNDKLTNIDSVSVKRNPTSDHELVDKKHLDDELDKNTIFRFNQTLKNSLKVSVGDDFYNLTKYVNIQLTDTTKIKYPNTGGYPLQNGLTKFKDKNNNQKYTKLYEINKNKQPNRLFGNNEFTSYL